MEPVHDESITAAPWGPPTTKPIDVLAEGLDPGESLRRLRFDAALIMNEAAYRLGHSQRPSGELAEDFREMADAALMAAQNRRNSDADITSASP